MSDSVSSDYRRTVDGDGLGTVWRPAPGKRGAYLLARLVASGGHAVRVRQLGVTRAGEIRLTRFLRNEAVTIDEMLEEAGRHTGQRCRGRHVLAIQDTTVLASDGGGGSYLHAVLALDADDGAILGLIDGQFLSRSDGKRAQRRSAPVEAKESFRWLQGADQAASICADAAQITVVADRESDIYEMFALRPPEVDLLVRAAHDRGIAEATSLFAQADAWPIEGRCTIELPAKPGRTKREAALEIRFGTVTLNRPAHGQRRDLAATVTVQLVDIRETAPPGGEAVHWRLLTTHTVTTAVEALAVADLYRRRWSIEQMFRTLKTKGFDIERLQIEDDAPRNRLIMATVIAAVRIQQLVHARDGDGPGPLRPLTDAFEPEDQPLLEHCSANLEGKTEKQKNPHPKGTLAFGAWVCARLGGWNCYYGKPGPITMLNGWMEFQSMKRALKLLMPAHGGLPGPDV